MPKTETFQDLSLAHPTHQQDRWRWLYTELRAAILDGRLKPGSRLPSTRNLARQYNLSRGTVVTAFDQLAAEGYTQSQISSGTFVAPAIPDHKWPARPVGARKTVPSRASLSKRAMKVASHVEVLPVSRTIGSAFRAHEPAIDLFPVELWARVAARVLRRAPRALYGQGHAAGYLPLRRAIAEYIGGARGVRCTPEQIIVTSGAQQALDLIGRLLLDPGDAVWMEDPGYRGAWQTLAASGAKIVPVPVDHDGMIVRTGRKLAPHARMAYVTPANQFPLGVTMSADRRLELLDWAARAGAWIVEDEYDAEYRYSGRPIASLQSLDQSGSVVYVGTFTKMLFNALRLGFLVVPERLIDAIEASRSIVDRHPPTLDQAVLAEFITDGHFGHHVRKMRQIYLERKCALKEAEEKYLSGLLTIDDVAAGMRTIGWLPHTASDRAVMQRVKTFGVDVVALSAFALKRAQKPGLVLGFAGCNPQEIRRGASVLATALESASSRR